MYYSGRKNILFYTTVGKPIINQLSCVFVCQALKLNFDRNSAMDENGDNSSSRVEVEDRDPNKINEHLQVKNKVK